jgi:hypothetical protein
MNDEETQRAYQLTFDSPQGKRVLADLVAYCFGRKSEFDPDPRIHAFNSGRRDVLMRIAEATNLKLEEIYALRGFGRSIAQKEETDA